MTGYVEAADSTRTPLLIGRSSSHFTRIVRMFAASCQVDYRFQAVLDLRSVSARDYGGNPAHRVPVLVTQEGSYFGSLNCCRVVQRLSTAKLQVIWPEALLSPLQAGAQELITQGMVDEVTLIMGGYVYGADCPSSLQKSMTSLQEILAWLESRIDELLNSLPSRDLSFLETSLFCFIEHLAFRNVMPLGHYVRLTSFAASYSQRIVCRTTEYRFD